MKAFDRIAARIDEALIEERIRALPVERQRALVERMAEAVGAFTRKRAVLIVLAGTLLGFAVDAVLH